MSRQIKFRGKSIHGLNPIIIGYLIKDDCDVSYIVKDDINSGWNKCEVFDETVGQFTGLTDKNGKDIYEGDILKLCEDKMGLSLIVERYKTGFEFHQRDWGARLYESATEGQIEITGNIHEIK